jgi:Iap family predicted aminopeptidase
VGLVDRRRLFHTARFHHDGKPLAGELELLLAGRDTHASVTDARVVRIAAGETIDPAAVGGAVVLHPYGGEGYDERKEQLRSAGAAAIVAIYGGKSGWDEVSSYFHGESGLASDEVAPITGLISAATAATLPAEGQLTASLDVTTSVRRYASHNVVGRLPGGAGGETGEAVLLLGHWDHLGVCAEDGDRICNGAVDNASGIAVLIEIARRLAAGPRLDREILFLATTAEEMGLLGAEHFAANPVRPADTILAAINLDTVAIHPAGLPLAVIGEGGPALEAALRRVAGELGRTIDADDEADAFVQRQDGWALAKAGIPSVMIGGSFSDMKLLKGFLEGDYHGPADEPAATLELGGAAEDANLITALVRVLGDEQSYRPAAR